MRRALPLLAVLALLLAAACKPPRDPRKVAQGDLSGRWTAVSAAVGAPQDTGEVAWNLTLRQGPAGKLDGTGTRAGRSGTVGFPLSGHRGESEVTLQFELEGEEVKYHGSVLNAKTLVGEMLLPRDTVHVSFRRE